MSGRKAKAQRKSRTPITDKLIAAMKKAYSPKLTPPSKVVIRPRRKIIFVFAYSFDWALEWAQQRGLQFKDWIYCHDVTQLAVMQQYDAVQLKFLKNWERNKEAEFIRQARLLAPQDTATPTDTRSSSP